MPVISTKLCQHVLRSDGFFIVVFQTLVSRNIADRTERRSAELARSFCDIVRHGKDLLALLVQEQVIITKVASTHVPVEILRLRLTPPKPFIPHSRVLVRGVHDLSTCHAGRAGARPYRPRASPRRHASPAPTHRFWLISRMSVGFCFGYERRVICSLTQTHVRSDSTA